jgi:hypothetical protein
MPNQFAQIYLFLRENGARLCLCRQAESKNY